MRATQPGQIARAHAHEPHGLRNRQLVTGIAGRPHGFGGHASARKVLHPGKVKAHPAQHVPHTHFRVRHDRVDKTGCVTLRHHSRLIHIGIGRAHKGERILLLVADRDVRVVNENGEPIRQLTIDPSRDYQGRGLW
jgi:hypothetical protein